ncbi:hypothetical protein [Anaeromyxobacter dehalogenans]|uniref:Uncharacterized protein n=1 Tax=Anaeromyxobacter dehalogenans (strain 2CP-C) TaxID=290397 RepID=Q2IHE5_ANADE|nr:hypothetical protein [Anaeromyxobacter dehalogenans]ABC84002.1 hypothetical protein Adeh_4238 [Anaeromyxobacter dehalogenans 2CP-C]
MLAELTLVITLGTATPALEARAELDAIATRIEQLKMRHLAGEDVGRELGRLLVRAQELAEAIDRQEGRAALPPAAAPAGELRERADALHDEADRVVLAIRSIDLRMGELRRALAQPSHGPAQQRAVVARGASVSRAPAQGSTFAEDHARLRALEVQRLRLVDHLARIRTEAAALEAEAAAQER